METGNRLASNRDFALTESGLASLGAKSFIFKMIEKTNSIYMFFSLVGLFCYVDVYVCYI